MGSVAEQGSGIGRGVTFVLFLVALACVGLIGVAGFAKFQLDRSSSVLSSTVVESFASSTASSGSENVSAPAVPSAELTHARLQSERDLRTWSLLLTFIAWSSLVIASALIVGIYLVLQKRHTPALRALGQSISNLARGDMQTPIWGTERHDAIGELARAVDLARYHFSQLPDLSLLSDQGPIRIKFEGNARTMFEAMMQQISVQASRIGDEAADLASTVGSQHKLLTDIPLRLNAALEHLNKYDQTHTAAIQRATQGMAAAAAQLEQLVPFMQNRAQGMAEVTQIAGTQVASTLKTLAETGGGLQASVNKTKETVESLSSSTKEVGERIFAALNLLQASSKVLNETTETSQSRLKELVDTLTNGNTKLNQIVDRVESRLESTAKAEETLSSLASRTEGSAGRLDAVVKSIGDQHEKMGAQVAQATQRLDQLMGSFNSTQTAMTEALQGVQRDGGLLSSVFQDLKTNNEQILAKLSRTSETGHEVVQHLAECSEKLMSQLQERLDSNVAAAQAQIESVLQKNGELAAQVSTAAQALNGTVDALENTQNKFQNVHTRFGDTIAHISGSLERQVADAFGKTEKIAVENQEKIASLTTSIDQALQRLTVLGQLTGTLGTVAGQLGQLVPSLGAGSAPHVEIDINAITSKLSADFEGHWSALLERLETLPVPTDRAQSDAAVESLATAEKLLGEFETRWRSSVEQIDSVRDDLAGLIEKQKDHLEMRMMLLDKQIKAMAGDKGPDSGQIAALQEIAATLENVNERLSQLEMINNKEAMGMHTNVDAPFYFGGMPKA